MKGFSVVFIVFIGLVSCSESNSETTNLEGEGKASSISIDSILSDKIMDDGSIRKNNFDDFIGLSTKGLVGKSKNYEVTQFSPEFLLVRQLRTYDKARMFSAILRVRNGKVIDSFILSDNEIVDCVDNGFDLVLLYGNENNQIEKWKTPQQSSIIWLSYDFDAVKEYSVRSDEYAVVPNKLKENAPYVAYFDVITGCTMCTVTVEAEFYNDKCHKVTEVSKANSESLSQEFLDKTFVNY